MRKKYILFLVTTLLTPCGHTLLANERPTQNANAFQQVVLGRPTETDTMLLIDGYCYPIYRIGETDYISAETVAHLGCEIVADTTETVIKNPYALERARYTTVALDNVYFDIQPVRIGNFKTYQLRSTLTSYIPIGSLATYYTFEEGDNCYFLKRLLQDFNPYDLNQYVRWEGETLTNVTADTLDIEVSRYTWNGDTIERTVQVIDNVCPGEAYRLEADDIRASEETALAEPSQNHQQCINYATLVSAVTIHDAEQSTVWTLQVGADTLQQGAPTLFALYEEAVAQEAVLQEEQKAAELLAAQKAEERMQPIFPETFVYGTMLREVKGLQKGERVHIWNAEGGYFYHIWYNGTTITVPWDSVQTDANPVVQKAPATKEAIEAFANQAAWASESCYLVWTDLYRQRTYVLVGEMGEWTLIREMLSTTGNNKTPTPSGAYTLRAKVPYFGVEKGYRCKNAVQIFDDYLYHSVKFNASGEYVLGGQVLGEQGSYGCIRLSPEDSEWFYTTMTLGTKVVIR